MGGRGSGKTRLGAEWTRGMARMRPPFASERHGLIALVGETLADVREVMIDGPSGLMALEGGDRPRYEASRRRLVWESGAVAHVFSSEDPDSLRGPQFHAAWCDEAGKWKNGTECFDMLQFGLRLGARPKLMVTTTPKPVPLIKRLVADASVVKLIMPTAENAANLAPEFLARVKQLYGNTRFGRQEIDGELIEDREGALWERDKIEAARGERPAELRRIVVAVDPPASSGRRSDACGIVAAGLGADGIAHVLADASFDRARPQDWAARAVGLWHALEADCLLAEVNQGGEMVRTVIASVDPSVPVRTVRATQGKRLRAEPVAALYEQGKVRHAGRFPALEDEMCDFGIDGLSGGRSPDRVDALVWAVTELLLGQRDVPRVRMV
ncbi:MAG: terminase family protein [Rhizobiaceae bacterium]|nr:terminase family protein [Rhizobiaceae bacterium]MCV0405489.1 terminase family protein [Rhizobiaceae bacterium]